MFNRYYQDELTYLRELGKEYAAAYPAIAPLLAERGDPDVERLLEGVAFLTGKIRHKLDDELPEIIHSVATLLFPQYLRQIPATSILEFTPLPNVVREKLRIAHGAEVGSTPVEGTTCRFRTTQEVELLPLSVESARIETLASNTNALRIDLRVTGGASLAALQLTSLRFYIHGERRLQDDVRLWIGEHVDTVSLGVPEGAGKEKHVATLPRQAVSLVGFDDPQALLPFPKTAYPGFRLLQEFFTLPQKFAFFEVSGLEALALAKAVERFSLVIHFKNALPRGVHLERDNLRLNCTPIINVFPHAADPIKFDVAKHEHFVRPGGSNPQAHEIYSIDSVSGIGRRSTQRAVIPPFLSFEHELHPEGAFHLFYQAHHRPATLGDGTDVYLSFGTPRDGSPPEFDVISIEASCTNRQLPSQLRIGDIRIPIATSPAVATFSNIAGVTAPLPAPMGRDLHWRVLAHMAMSYRSIAEIEILRSVISVYNFQAIVDRQAARANQMRLEAIRSIEVKPMDRLYRGIPVRGVSTNIELDEQGFSGEGEMYLFGGILNEIFGSYVSLNSFTELRVTGKNTRALYKWPPKNGTTALL